MLVDNKAKKNKQLVNVMYRAANTYNLPNRHLKQKKKKELQHINRFANHRRARYQLSPKLNGRATVNYGPVNRQKTNQNWPIAEPLDDNLTSDGGD